FMNSHQVRSRNCVPGILVPQLELVQLAYQHYVLIQVGIFTQTRRDQKTTTAIEFEVDGITDQQTLQAAVLFTQRRQCTQFGFNKLPLIERVNAQTTINGIDGDD